MSLYDIELTTITGGKQTMAAYKGNVLLVVNTATLCGFTPQLTGLQALYDKYRDRGFIVLGFPCNQFGGQEPGENADIQSVCERNYGVTFPMFAKTNVNGPDAHPLFTHLKKEKRGFLIPDIKWNFTKFLVDREGNVVDRYAPNTPPDELENAIESLLEFAP